MLADRDALAATSPRRAGGWARRWAARPGNAGRRSPSARPALTGGHARLRTQAHRRPRPGAVREAIARYRAGERSPPSTRPGSPWRSPGPRPRRRLGPDGPRAPDRPPAAVDRPDPAGAPRVRGGPGVAAGLLSPGKPATGRWPTSPWTGPGRQRPATRWRCCCVRPSTRARRLPWRGLPMTPEEVAAAYDAAGRRGRGKRPRRPDGSQVTPSPPTGTPVGGRSPRPSAIPAGRDARGHLTMSGLRERGWSDAMIRDYLGDPDATRPNPRYRSAAPMKLYLAERAVSPKRALNGRIGRRSGTGGGPRARPSPPASERRRKRSPPASGRPRGQPGIPCRPAASGHRRHTTNGTRATARAPAGTSWDSATSAPPASDSQEFLHRITVNHAAATSCRL